MNQQHRTAIPVEERMPICEHAHDEARPLHHLLCIVTMPQPIFDGKVAVTRMAKEY